METIINFISEYSDYHIIFAFGLFMFILLCHYKWSCIKYHSNEHFQNRIKNESPANFHNIIGNLLDNRNLSDKLVLEIDINSMESLLKHNYNYKTLNKEPLLNAFQEKLVETFIQYRDYYFIDKTQSEIVTLVRNNIDENILESLTEEQQLLALNLFRRNIFYFYEHYFDKIEFKNKIKWMQTNMGLRKIGQFVNGLNTMYQDKNWFGVKYIRLTSNLPIGITIYNPESNIFYYRHTKNIWFKFKLNVNNTTVNDTRDMNTLETMNEITDIDKYRKLYKHLHLWYDTDPLKNYTEDWTDVIEHLQNNTNITSDFYTDFEKINSNTIPADSYLFFDYPSSDNLETLTKVLVRIAVKDNSILGNNIDIQNIGFWIQNLDLTNNDKTQFIRNLILSYYYASFETFMDLLSIMLFHNIQTVSSIVNLFPDISAGNQFNNYWTYRNWDLIQRNSLKMSQCNSSAIFTISKTSGSNWKFNYNGTDYYNYWSAIETFINDLINTITLGLKTTNTNIVSSVAEFCYINNKSFIDYLVEGSKCEEDTCNDVDISRLYEPDRCQNLKDKYRILYLQIVQKECTDLKNNGTSNPVTKDKMMFDIMKLALNLRNCQIDFTLPERQCIDDEQTWKLDVDDKATDKDLSQIETDRKFILDDSANSLFTPYDRQVQEYHKLMATQEKIELTKLNQLANHLANNKQKNIDDMTLSQFGSYLSNGILDIVDNMTEPNATRKHHQYDANKQINNTGIINSNDPTLITKTQNVVWQEMTGNMGMPVSNDLMEGFVVNNANANTNTNTNNTNNLPVQNIVLDNDDLPGAQLWEPEDEKNLQNLYDKDGNKKNINIINEDTRNTSNTSDSANYSNKISKQTNDINNTEFNRISKELKTQLTQTTDGSLSNKFMNMMAYLKLFINIITNKDRLMFSGSLFLLIAFSLYFIDITS
jgi:hypothetical protein